MKMNISTQWMVDFFFRKYDNEGFQKRKRKPKKQMREKEGILIQETDETTIRTERGRVSGDDNDPDYSC